MKKAKEGGGARLRRQGLVAVQVTFTPAERSELAWVAACAGFTLGEFVRQAALYIADGMPEEEVRLADPENDPSG